MTGTESISKTPHFKIPRPKTLPLKPVKFIHCNSRIRLRRKS